MTEQFIFNSLCERIRTEYQSQKHKMSWSFLYTPQSTLHSSQKLLFVGLNPAGNDREIYTEAPSCEDGNDYLHGKWAETWGRGEAHLQIQVQQLFKRIALAKSATISYQDLMDNSLAANYVPFRSKDWDTLSNKKETLNFAKELWSEIFNFVKPRAVVCISIVAYEGIKKILLTQGFKYMNLEEREAVGWGNVTYQLTELSNGEQTALLIRLPHLSRYSIFNNSNCDIKVNYLAKRIANVL